MFRNGMQTRTISTTLNTRADENECLISGYFSLFNEETELCPGIFEEISPGAFDNVEGSDVRALVNHDTTLVLGRTTVGTLTLSIDKKGLYGKILINQNDRDAMNLYERVKRGDVSQCSFGFDILEEENEYKENGEAKFTVKKVELYEVSVCTFPAYENTGVQARMQNVEAHKEKQRELRKNNLKERLKNVEKTDA